MPDYVAKFAKRLAEIERRVSQMGQSGLATSSIEGGGIDINDELGNYLTTVGLHPDGTYGVGYNIDSTVIKEGGIETPSLAANSVTADKVNAESVAAAIGEFLDVIAHRVLIYSTDADGNPYVSTRLTGDGQDAIEIIADPDDPPVASIGSAGDVSANTVASEGDITVAGTPLVGKLLDPAAPDGILDQLPRALVDSYTFRDLATMGTQVGQSGYGSIGQIDVTLPGGRTYEFSMPWRVNPSKVSGSTVTELVFACRAFMTATTDGSEPPLPTTSGATPLASNDERTPATRATGSGDYLIARFPTAVDTRVKILVALYSDTGTQVTPSTYGLLDWVAQVADIGPAKAALPGALPGAGSRQTLKTVWQATDSRTWNAAGSQVYTSVPQSMGVGTSSGLGLLHCAAVFNGAAVSGDDKGQTMAQVFTGDYIVTQVRFGFQSTTWENGSGELQIQKFSGTTLATTDRKTTGTMVKQAYTARNQWQWVTDPSMTSWISGSNRGVYCGPPDWQGSETHGMLASAKYATASQRPQLEVTYTKIK